jgi:hypothetical protein
MGLLSLFAILFPLLLILAVLFSLRYLHWPAPNRRVLLLAWASALLLPLGMLLLPRYTLVPDHTNPFFLDPFYTIYTSIRYLLPPLAWILASLLLSFGLAGVQSQPAAPGSWRAVASLALSAVLLVYSIYDLYWLFVWDQTGDAVYVALLPIPVTAVIVAGVHLTSEQKWYGLAYTLLLGAALFTAFSISIRVDHQQITAARAGQVSRAIERFYAPGTLPHHTLAARPMDAALTTRASDHPRAGLVLPVGRGVLPPGNRDPRQLEQPLLAHPHVPAGRSDPGHSRLMRR